MLIIKIHCNKTKLVLHRAPSVDHTYALIKTYIYTQYTLNKYNPPNMRWTQETCTNFKPIYKKITYRSSSLNDINVRHFRLQSTKINKSRA